MVLGAGFSFGIKNNTLPNSLSQIKSAIYEDFENIPLVDAYISLTNKIFIEKVTTGEAAANVWENNKFSINENNVLIDLTGFYQNLFTVDEDFFNSHQLKTYKNFLIPDWYQIYTFNFDNLFETIVKLKSRTPFYSLHFPEHSGIKRTAEKAIVHLHGYIAKTGPEKLTFSQTTYDFLRNSEHSLYDQFYTDVNSGKKLVIIGTQFDEKVIDQKFFDGLISKNITIYHFDLRNENFKTKPGIANNPNYHFIKIKNVVEVSDFLEKLKSVIQEILVDGALTINPEFKAKVEKEGQREGFTVSDFYLAKQVDECQWYGIVKNWVVEREFYRKLKEEIVSSFFDINRESKVGALVWGKGGSGKSTMLRKLAIDLCNEDFVVLWIKDKEIQEFYTKGLVQIPEYFGDRQFLIVIEDLYRIKQNQNVRVKEIIDSICSNKNVRLIIGDRRCDDDSYKEHIYDPDMNIFELTVNDNKKTLEKLLENIQEWKEVSATLMTSDEDYQSSLYYILWTIGRTAQKKLEGGDTIKFKDLKSHFRSLVESDLKTLSGNYYRQPDGTIVFTQFSYPGVAKGLYYWASIYATNKIYISYDLFFKIADLFNDPKASNSKLITASPSYKSILDIYSYEAKGFIKSAGDTSLFAFNHDILAEEGLSKAKLTEWTSFDDSIKLKMLPLIVKEGDKFSASVFLSHCLHFIPDLQFSKREKRWYIDELLSKENFGLYLMQGLSKDYYSMTKKIELANKILSHHAFWNLPKDIVSTSLNISKNKSKVDSILNQNNFWSLSPDIVTTALNISKDKSKADKILIQNNFWKISPDIVSTALNISRDKTKADEILRQDNFWNLPKEIVTTALNIANDKTKAEKILSQDNFWKLSPAIVSTALTISKNKFKADEILKQPNFWNLPTEIVTTALNVSQDKLKADQVLSSENFWNLPKEISSRALHISANKEIKDRIAKALFASGQWKEKWGLTYQILRYYSFEGKIPEPIDRIVTTIIEDHFKKKSDKGVTVRYINLMRIPFHNVPIWKKTSLENISRWQSQPRNLVTNTISAYRSKPELIRKLCTAILRDWQKEITEPISLIGRRKKSPHYGDHIRLCLGHPDLRQLAEQVAKEIKTAESNSPDLVPLHLMEVVKRIVDDKVFPSWDPKMT